MSTQMALLDVDSLKINNWENFIKNNENIIFHMENACASAGTIDMIISKVDKIVDNINIELLKLKIRKVTNRPKLYDLLSNLKQNNNSMKNELVDKAYQVAIGLKSAEYIIDAYNNGTEIDSDVTAFIKRIMSGNITEGDKAEALNLISLTLPVSAIIIGSTVNKKTAKIASKGFSALSKFGVNKLQSYVVQRTAENVLKLSDGTIVKLQYPTFKTEFIDKPNGLPNAKLTGLNYLIGIGSGAFIGGVSSAIELAINGEWSNRGEYDNKYNATSIIGNILLGSASSAMSLALGPVGAGATLVFGSFGSLLFNGIKDSITDDYMADTFMDSNGKKYTIYGNGSGRQAKSNKMLPKISKLTPEYTYRGVKVPESVYKNNLYKNTKEFLGKEKTELSVQYDCYQNNWNNLELKLKGCSTVDEAKTIFEQYMHNQSTDMGFIGHVTQMHNNYGWNIEDYWKYTHNINSTQ